MEKDFVEWDEALAVRELGFNEKCYKGWYKKAPIYPDKPTDLNGREPIGQFVSAPTYAQLFRWFREKYNLFHLIEPVAPDDFRAVIIEHPGRIYYQIDDRFDTYEGAELECLRNLIKVSNGTPLDTNQLKGV